MTAITDDHQGIASKILFFPTEERTARELQQLPKEERQQVWADMTGDPQNTYYRIHAETPEFIQESLDNFDQAMTSHTADANALRMAIEQDPVYVKQQRIKFLRADNFSCKDAVNRMVLHYQHKLDLFGADKLGRDIRLDDLSEDDMESLRAGGMQILPMQDHASRGVIFTRQSNYSYKCRENMVSLRCCELMEIFF